MQNILLFPLYFFIVATVTAQSAEPWLSPQWTADIKEFKNGMIYDCISTTDRGFLIACNRPYIEDRRCWLAKIDSIGQIQWMESADSCSTRSCSRIDTAWLFQPSPEQFSIIKIKSHNDSCFVALNSYDLSGQIQHQGPYLPIGLFRAQTAVQITNDNYMIAGMGKLGRDQYKCAFVGLSPEGVIDYFKVHSADSMYSPEITSCFVESESKVIICGSSHGSNYSEMSVFAKGLTVNAEELWKSSVSVGEFEFAPKEILIHENNRITLYGIVHEPYRSKHEKFGFRLELNSNEIKDSVTTELERYQITDSVRFPLQMTNLCARMPSGNFLTTGFLGDYFISPGDVPEPHFLSSGYFFALYDSLGHVLEKNIDSCSAFQPEYLLVQDDSSLVVAGWIRTGCSESSCGITKYKVSLKTE